MTRLLAKLKRQRVAQNKKDKAQFSGMFDRGTVCKDVDSSASAVKPEKKKDDNYDIEKKLKEAELLVDIYMSKGKVCQCC